MLAIVDRDANVLAVAGVRRPQVGIAAQDSGLIRGRRDGQGEPAGIHRRKGRAVAVAQVVLNRAHRPLNAVGARGRRERRRQPVGIDDATQARLIG